MRQDETLSSIHQKPLWRGQAEARSQVRGVWTGGRPILGYDVVNKKLVDNENEAEQVWQTFKLYPAHTSLREAVDELNHRARRNKSIHGKRGQQVIGKPFTKTRCTAH